MTREIIVPLIGPEHDPGRAAEQALPYARAMAARLGGNLVLVSVVDVDEKVEARERYLESLQDDHPDRRRLPVVVVSDEPADAIVSVAENLQDSIVVMASHSRTGLKRMLLGSVALQVVVATDRPVMVVPVSERPVASGVVPAMTRLLLLLDDSFMAAAVLQIAVDTLGPDDLALHLIEVLEPLSTRAGFMEGEYQSTVRQATTHYLNRVAEELESDGFDVEWQIRVGEPASEIATVARESGSDLIVMPTHGRQGLGRFIFSSVGKHLAESAPVPLLLVRPDEEMVDRARVAARVVRSSS